MQTRCHGGDKRVDSTLVRTGRVLAVDVGGTKLAAGVVTSSGEVLAEARTPTGVLDEGGGEALFERLERLCRDVLADASVAVDGIGVGCGDLPAWRDFPLRERMARAFGHACVVENDATAFALGEWWLGAGRGKQSLLGIVVSSDVGGGLIVDGRLLHGSHGHAGHVGHVNVQPDGPECSCGAGGCVTAFASESGIARRYREAIGTAKSAAQVANLARSGDPLAARLLREAAEALGRMIASVEALCDLELVVIGGSLGTGAWDLLEGPLLDELRRRSRLTFTRELHVTQSALGERGGLFGAAALALGAE